MATAVTHNSATIRWTVPSIAYTPETYVVRYGTTNVNRVSNEMSSGSDISVTDLTLSVQLTGLEQLTEYMYEVQSSSSMGRATTSSRETFMTTNLRKFLWCTVYYSVGCPGMSPPQDSI